MNAWRHLKLQNPSGISPNSPKRPCFPCDTLFTTMWHQQKQAESRQTLHIHVPPSNFYRTAETTKHTEICVCVCAWKRWMGRGCSQGYFRDLALPLRSLLSLILPLSHTHTSLPHLCSEVVCNREERRSRSTPPLKWRRGGYSHQARSTYVHAWTRCSAR